MEKCTKMKTVVIAMFPWENNSKQSEKELTVAKGKASL